MVERVYPDDMIKDCAIQILYKSIPEHRFDIWNVISEDVINHVKENTGVCDGRGFVSYDVKRAIGTALCKYIKN